MAFKTRIPWGYLTWPNRISLLRLLLVPPFVVLMLHQHDTPGYRHMALVIFVVMALSDMLDGFLARRLKLRSRLGAILDPLADKALIICSAVLLSLPSSAIPGLALPDWVVVSIVGKDLWVIVGFAILFVLTGKVHVRPTRPGKLCTAGQLVMVATMLISPELDGLGLSGSSLSRALWYVVAGLCVLAVLAYTRLGVGLAAESDADARHGNHSVR